MKIRDIPVPEVYSESYDFRILMDWVSECLTKIQADTENLIDLIDPERCPENLLWLLADTIGYRYNDEFYPSYNRLILLYFMSMIRNRGSRTGMMIAAETNLAQFPLMDPEEEIDANRLEDTSIPVNSVYVSEHPDMGYIDVVYYSESVPKDACIEYVRPLGMYCFTHAGVRVDSRTKVSIDARLTDERYTGIPIGPTKVGHYRRADYASLQPVDYTSQPPEFTPRRNTWMRNSQSEGDPWIIDSETAGLRSLFALQLCNNEHVVKSLLPSVEGDFAVFSLGKGPLDVSVTYPENYLKMKDKDPFNLRVDPAAESSIGSAVTTLDEDRSQSVDWPAPSVNPPMATVGDAMAINAANTKYVVANPDGSYSVQELRPKQ